MTEKQQRILSTALELFSQKGFDATSTSSIAKEAGVSEGLIFRHFSNKEGLLLAIMEQGKEISFRMYSDIINRSDPKEVVKGILELPFALEPEYENFWKLIYSLKWQAEVYDHSFSAPLQNALIKAFSDMGYKDPKAEAEIVSILIDGLAVALLLRKPNNIEDIKQSILKKYNL